MVAETDNCAAKNVPITDIDRMKIVLFTQEMRFAMKCVVRFLPVIAMLAGSVFAQVSIKSKGSDGWGYSDKYEQNFNKYSIQTYYAEVKSVDTVTPFPDMAQGIQLVATVDGSECFIHLGPAWFILRQDNLGFAKGDKIDIKGVKVNLNGKAVIMPSVVTRKDRDLLLRDDDGIPYWAVWRKN